MLDFYCITELPYGVSEAVLQSLKFGFLQYSFVVSEDKVLCTDSTTNAIRCAIISVLVVE